MGYILLAGATSKHWKKFVNVFVCMSLPVVVTGLAATAFKVWVIPFDCQNASCNFTPCVPFFQNGVTQTLLHLSISHVVWLLDF